MLHRSLPWQQRLRSSSARRYRPPDICCQHAAFVQSTSCALGVNPGYAGTSPPTCMRHTESTCIGAGTIVVSLSSSSVVNSATAGCGSLAQQRDNTAPDGHPNRLTVVSLPHSLSADSPGARRQRARRRCVCGRAARSSLHRRRLPAPSGGRPSAAPACQVMSNAARHQPLPAILGLLAVGISTLGRCPAHLCAWACGNWRTGGRSLVVC